MNRRMPESKSGALPLGDIPMFDRAHWGLYHEQDRFAILFSGKPVQSRVLPSVFSGFRYYQKPRIRDPRFLCWHYLSSRQVTLQVLSARTSLTSVFGMGTGGPSPQSIPTSSWLIATLCQRLSSVTVSFPYTLKTEHCVLLQSF